MAYMLNYILEAIQIKGTASIIHVFRMYTLSREFPFMYTGVHTGEFPVCTPVELPVCTPVELPVCTPVGWVNHI